jgi:hypothetical protein
VIKVCSFRLLWRDPGCGAGKITDQRAQPSSVSTASATQCRGELPASYKPGDVKVLGSLRYGQTSRLVDCSAIPRYRAFVFDGYGGESDRKAIVGITESSLNQISRGATHLRVRLPDRGPDLEAWYIVFHDFDNRPARFTIQLQRIEECIARGSFHATRQTMI